MRKKLPRCLPSRRRHYFRNRGAGWLDSCKWCSLPNPYRLFPEKWVEHAIKHHKKHGDMDGEICLLNRCALHYPKKE